MVFLNLYICTLVFYLKKIPPSTNNIKSPIFSTKQSPWLVRTSCLQLLIEITYLLMPNWPLSVVARVWPVGLVYSNRCWLNVHCIWRSSSRDSLIKKKKPIVAVKWGASWLVSFKISFHKTRMQFILLYWLSWRSGHVSGRELCC